MKRISKNGALFFSVLFCILFVSCSKDDDNEVEWGTTTVYMPQAIMLNGGTNNNYPVPLNNNPSTRNYILDTVAQKVSVVLGVSRSGLQSLQGFTVKVETYLDTTSKIITAGAIANAVLLPQDLYTLPTEVSVPEGKREEIFYLIIDRAKLIQNYSHLNGKKLVLTVGINSSDKNNLVINKSLSKTVVIIDAKTFM